MLETKTVTNGPKLPVLNRLLCLISIAGSPQIGGYDLVVRNTSFQRLHEGLFSGPLGRASPQLVRRAVAWVAVAAAFSSRQKFLSTLNQGAPCSFVANNFDLCVLRARSCGNIKLSTRLPIIGGK